MKMRNRKKKKLPIGISDFKEIIENNYYYFDKTYRKYFRRWL